MGAFRLQSQAAIIAIAATALMLLGEGPAWAQSPAPKKFTATTMQVVALGDLPGKWSMKSTMLVIEPGGEIPFHVHKGPGLRYVIDGAITISWKEGKSETFSAGSTYFEGAGANHPAGTIAARNDGSTPCRVVIVELVPQE
jgi:quercetin dioxygenase-like cupin family protein